VPAEAAATVANIQLVVERATLSAPERLFAPGPAATARKLNWTGTGPIPAPKASHDPLA
jgi:hypothetical protein